MSDSYLLVEDQVSKLLELLEAQGRKLIGPRVKEAGIVYAELKTVRDLPQGYADSQAPGHYRLQHSDNLLWFGYAAPVRPLKHWFWPERERLLTLRRSKEGVDVRPEPLQSQKIALFGVRACDLAGLDRLDDVLKRSEYSDVRYAARREDVFVVAVNCTKPSATCFCAPMRTGPRAKSFDLALTEGVRDGKHEFVLEIGSEAGAELVSQLKPVTASAQERSFAHQATDQAAQAMRRRVDPERARDLLRDNLEHPEWDAVADRCMACANCTASCPTCFCSTLEEATGLDVDQAERYRRMDSCFNADFSYVHGGPVRSSLRSRYRQWLTHKFSTWYDQFGSSGCVGCGRCITWCPVGIDVTEEIARIGAKPQEQSPP